MDNIIISQSTTALVNLSDYGAPSLSITVQPGVYFSCIYNKATYQNMNIVFHIQRDATLHCVLLISDDEHSTMNVAVSLEDEYAQATVRGLYALNGSQKLSITTLQHHKAPHTTSNLIVKGMLSGASQADYRGNILVDDVAKYTHALQENKNILLSRSACAQSIPSLEVLTNDVHCKHGTAVGYLDDQALFYAQSRGLDVQMAEQLLLHGFFDEIIDGLDATVISDIYEIIRERSQR